MKIEKMIATISGVRDLSPTAREIELTLPRPLTFVPGAFINVFFPVAREKIRRAYSISSDPAQNTTITISIRNVSGGKAGQFFWNDDIIGNNVEIQGPLGLNTIDKMQKPRAFLFGFGIGVSVIKAVAHALVNNPRVEEIVIMTGNRDESEILYKEFFERLADSFPHVSFTYALTRGDRSRGIPIGYIQDHIGDFDFNDADVYVCGQEAACTALVDTIKKKRPSNSAFLVEAFH
jgi:NAD(P)H-flavin reductase